MQKMMQRLFSVLFALVFTIALVTIAAGAEDPATEVSTIDQLKEAAVTGGNFRLTADLTVNEIIVIQKDLTIDGDGHTITGTANKTFEVGNNDKSYFPENVTFKNITLTNTSCVPEQGRSIDTRVGGLTLTLDNAHLSATATNAQPLTIGGNAVDRGEITVNIQNGSTIDAGASGYSIIIYNPVNMTIKDSTVKGLYSALYFKGANKSLGSADSVVSVVNSTISSVNSFSGASNAFATVVFEDKNITLNVDKDSTISAESKGDQPQFVLGFKEVTDITINVEGKLSGANLIGGNKAGNKITVPVDYVDEMVAQGGVVAQNVDTGALYVTLAEALADAKAGATIKLLADLTLDETTIDKDVTIDGDGHTVTSAAKRTFGVGDAAKSFFPKNVTFKNIKLVNTSTMQHGGRSINTRVGGITLTLDNVHITATNAPNAQALLIGGDAGEQGALTINIVNGSTIDAGKSGYSIITYNPVKMKIEDSTIKGLYSALYFKGADGSLGSAGSVVEIISSTISSENPHNGESNAFGTIVFEDDDITVKVDSSSTVSAVNTENQYQAILLLKGHTGINANIAGKLSSETLILNYVLGSTILIPVDYVDQLRGEGYVTVANGDQVYVYPAHEHDCTTFEAKAPGCTEDGNVAYYVCKVCNQIAAELESGKVVVESLEATVLPALGHKLTKVPAAEAGCTAKGTNEHYTCSGCDKLFKDAEGKTEIAGKDTIVDATSHKLTKVPAVDPTYTAAGNIEYYTCTCGKLFKDFAGLSEIKLADTVLPQLIKVEESKAEVSSDAVDKALEDAIADSDPADTEKPVEVVIDLVEITEDETIESIKIVEAILPVTSLEKISEKEATLTINMSNVTVTMDAKTLDTISKKAEGTTVTLKVEEVATETLNEEQKAAVEDLDVAATISASIICAVTEDEIHEFDGGVVTVQLPFTPAEGTEGSDYAIYYIADDGTIEKIETAYVDGALVFSLEHFSEYVVVNTKNVVETPTEPDTPAVPDTPVEPEDPDTGDSNSFVLMYTVMILALVAMGAAMVTKKRLVR